MNKCADVQLNNYTFFNAKDYTNLVLNSDIKKYANENTLKTGYKNIDAITNLFPGLYVIGAISSLGKTTFVQQMADQIAMENHPILFFSLEQSIIELVSKSLSRIMVKQDCNTESFQNKNF